MIIDQNERDTAQVSHATKIGSNSSPNLLRELKFMQDGQYFTECQKKCLDLSTCIGIQFNKQNYDCKMVDVLNSDSMTSSLSVNYTGVQLIHPQRNSKIYGFQTQLIAK